MLAHCEQAKTRCAATIKKRRRRRASNATAATRNGTVATEHGDGANDVQPQLQPLEDQPTAPKLFTKWHLLFVLTTIAVAITVVSDRLVSDTTCAFELTTCTD
jgi:hypothetical protein